MKKICLDVVFMKRSWIIVDWLDKSNISKKFSHREEAYHEAMLISDKVYVHDKNGIVCFVGENKNKK